MKRKLLTTFILAVAPLLATAESTASSPLPPQLTSTEKLALQTISQEFQKAQQDLMAFQADVAAAHPGYHLNSQSGILEENPKPAPAVPMTPDQKGHPADKK